MFWTFLLPTELFNFFSWDFSTWRKKINFNSNSQEKFFQLSGKIFPESWKNFSGELQLKLKLIFFLQVEKSQEKNLNNSLGNRKVQNNPENCKYSTWFLLNPHIFPLIFPKIFQFCLPPFPHPISNSFCRPCLKLYLP